MTKTARFDLDLLQALLMEALPQSGGSLPGTRPDLETADETVGDLMLALARLAPPADPPPGLFDAIEAEIEREEPKAIRTLRAGEGEWFKWADSPWKKALFGDKIWKKILFDDETSGRCAYLLRCEPGAIIPAHRHARDEHVFVIEGEYVVGNTVVKAGDYQFSPAGSRHTRIHSPRGCLVLVHV